MEINLESSVTDTYLSRMNNEFKRKEVWLHDKVVERLIKLAEKKKWSLKSYMEHVLVIASNRKVKK